MVPTIDPNSMMQQIYKTKVEHAQHHIQMYMLKTSIKVLRNEFGFSPEMINEFVTGMEKEIKENKDTKRY